MNQQNIGASGEVWTENWQLTADGDFQWFLTSNKQHEARKLDKRIIARTVVMHFDDEGWLVGMDNNYEQLLLDGAGNKVPGLEVSQPHQLNKIDRRFFAQHFAPPIRHSFTNGYFRGPLGLNYYPPYDAYAQLIAYTQEPIATRNYATHDVDGTPLSPVAEEPEAIYPHESGGN